MSELMRFRLARAPQKRAVGRNVRVYLERNPSKPPDGYDREAFRLSMGNLIKAPERSVEGSIRNGITVLGKPAALQVPINELDRWLTSRENQPSVEALNRKLHGLGEAIEDVEGGEAFEEAEVRGGELGENALRENARRLILLSRINWWRDRRNVGFSLLTAMLRDSEPSRAMYLNRLLLIFGLVELAAEEPGLLKTADDIRWALRSRSVCLPQEFVETCCLRRNKLLARRPGFSDLYIARDEWARYEAGEIAHVENVMASETRERSHTQTTEAEETFTIEEEQNKLEERDTQSTDRFDLHKEASRDTSLNIGLEGEVDTSGQYGPTKVNTHLGGSLDYSLNESEAQATTTAQEIVSRAVVRLEERVRETRVTRSLSRIVEKDRHLFENVGQDADHIVGIYRWVDKIKRVQIVRYPNRFLLEFQVPEPGAWLRWLLDRRRGPITIADNPEALKIEVEENGVKTMVDLTPDHLNSKNYMQIASRYKTLGLKPPPDLLYLGNTITRPSPDDPKADAEPIRFVIDTQLTVPAGYVATNWDATIQAWHNGSFGNDNASVSLAVGSGEEQSISGTGSFFKQLSQGNLQVTAGKVPISVMSDTVYGYNIDMIFTCVPTRETSAAWQIDTYERIAQAYYALKRQYDEELAAQRVGSGVQIEGQSTVRNAEMARDEIKKSVIEMLTGTDFTGRNAIRRLDANNLPIPPEVDLQKAAHIASEIQFVEQAFEWENVTYVLYPYFWADKQQWEQLADLSSADADFARFLRSGSARVVVPARPGFGLQTWLYANCGILWGGGPAPGPGDDDYLSVADEIRAQDRPPRDGIRGESWDVRLPTTLVWLDNVNAGLPIDNPNIELDPPPGQVLS